MTTYLDCELFSLQLEGQVLVVREFTRQTVQVRDLTYIQEAYCGQGEQIVKQKIQARYSGTIHNALVVC